MEKIYAFIRITDSGNFEQVTWYKEADASKRAVISPIKPTGEHLQKLINNKYSETYL